jgi:16S rRNA (cytidine1402-2'-O)-methyltransferase
MTGRLVLVATPIGNLDDLSPRAIASLSDADVVVCEDSRRTGRLLERAGVGRRQLLVANEHTEAAASADVRRLLDQGATVAVVTDAGSPGISDPGERLVRVAVEGGHDVTAVPGPAAVIAAITVSGLPTQRFVMEGFLPRRGRERQDRLHELAAERRTIVLYEAPHRLARTLGDLVAVLGPDRTAVISRELTKLHEETWRGTLAEALERAQRAEPRGEHVLVVAGAAPAPAAEDEQIVAALARHQASGLNRRSAIAAVVEELGAPKRRVYQLAHRPPLGEETDGTP